MKVELNDDESTPMAMPGRHYTSNKEIKNIDRWPHKWIRSVVCRNIRNIMRQISTALLRTGHTDCYEWGKRY